MTGDTLYVWQSLEPTGWSTITARIPFIADREGPLMARSLAVADRFAPLAIAHGKGLGQHVRLVRFENPEIMRSIPHA